MGRSVRRVAVARVSLRRVRPSSYHWASACSAGCGGPAAGPREGGARATAPPSSTVSVSCPRPAVRGWTGAAGGSADVRPAQHRQPRRRGDARRPGPRRGLRRASSRSAPGARATIDVDLAPGPLRVPLRHGGRGRRHRARRSSCPDRRRHRQRPRRSCRSAEADLIGRAKAYEALRRVARCPALAALVATLHGDLAGGDRVTAERDWLTGPPGATSGSARPTTRSATADGAINGLPNGCPDGVHDKDFTGFHRDRVRAVARRSRRRPGPRGRRRCSGRASSARAVFATAADRPAATSRSGPTRSPRTPWSSSSPAHATTAATARSPRSGPTSTAPSRCIEVLHAAAGPRYTAAGRHDARPIATTRRTWTPAHARTAGPRCPRSAASERELIDSRHQRAVRAAGPVAAICEPRVTS